MPALSNHTHCHVAQNADTQTKTCQRVWLPIRTDSQQIIKHEITMPGIKYWGLGV